MLRAFFISVSVVVVLSIPFLIPVPQPPESSQAGSASGFSEPGPDGKPPVRIASLDALPSSSNYDASNQLLAGQLSQGRNPSPAGKPRLNGETFNAGDNQSGGFAIVDVRQVAFTPPPILVQAPQTPVGGQEHQAAIREMISSAPQGYFGKQVSGIPAGYGPGPILDANGQIIGMVPGNGAQGTVDPRAFGMVPDFNAAQSFALPGNATGPDLSAAPMEFTPVASFGDVFSYNATPQWIRNRWPRVSNCPADTGLRGQRVALVTGTNSWDLHGSLTYYFDEYQKCRRITFRGWAGDASKFVQFLQQRHGFKQQPTKWAGFYLAKSWRKTSGGLLMKNPPVTYAENKVQQVGVLLEMNDQQSKFGLSQDFVSLIDGSERKR